MMRLCDYGCGNEAKFQMLNGKMCCSKSVNSCPAMRIKNSIGGRNYARTHHKRSSYGMRGKTAWNKGLTKETDKRVADLSTKISKSLIGKSHPQTKETRAKISMTRKRLGLGGPRHGSGRGKKGWYNGYFCDSSWELAYVIYNLDHGINFSRNTKGFEYEFGGQKRKYYPDFLLETGEYVEIKGYYSKQVYAKIDQFPKDKILIIYDGKGIQPFLNYVVDKYGNDFYTLYEKS